MDPRLASNSSFSLLSTGITGVYHHVQKYYVFKKKININNNIANRDHLIRTYTRKKFLCAFI
jgi:hypothetical protein